MMKNYLKKLMGCSCEYESHMKNIFRLISRHLQSFHPSNLLDVGCGDGSRTLRLARHFMIPADHTYGLDSHYPHVDHCPTLFNSAFVNLESEQLPYNDQTFDLVICNQVLEHLKNYHNVLDNIVRVTKSGGYILIGIPNLAHLINRFYLLFGVQPMCMCNDFHSTHVRGFTHKDFEQTLKSTPGIIYIDCAGSELIYPLPLTLARPLSRMCVGICAYVCYLARKQ